MFPRTIWIILTGERARGGEGMSFALYQRVVLTQDLPDERLRVGDVGVIVEHYPARPDVPDGYELEVFAANGQMVGRCLGAGVSGKRRSTTS